MKHIELLSELLYSAHIGGLANKKRVLDTAMRKDGLKGIQLRKAEQATTAGLNRLRRMFPRPIPIRAFSQDLVFLQFRSSHPGP